MKRHNIYKTVLGLAIAALTLTACSDEWDEHYNGSGVTGTLDGTLWDAIKSDNNLSNFAKVVQACGYDKSLAGSQVFTVFAPTNASFSSEEADALIAAYNEEKGDVEENENSTIKEFIQNHIALYNHSVSSSGEDSITLMNGKYAILKPDGIDNSKFLTSNLHYKNGILFTVADKVQFSSNLFEYLRKDNDLDSLKNFFYNKMFYRSEFQANQSVPGGIVDGKTIYLDSVFRMQNDLYGIKFLDANLSSEDSTYIMIAPTNKVWRELLEEYSDYFNYDNTVRYRDSIHYTNTRLAITQGTIFSRTFNSDVALRDSAISTNTSPNGSARLRQWGNDSLHYYEYFNPLQSPSGIMTGATNIACSNGTMLKADDWKILKDQTFFQTRIIEAENYNAIREVSTAVNSSTGEREATIIPKRLRVEADNAFYNKVSRNEFVEFEPTRTSGNHSVTFNITNVLSNIGYDIYLVTAPALANDSNATVYQRMPTILRCSIGFNNQEGVKQTKDLVSSVTTNPDVVDAILLASDFKFPVCSYGLNETEPQVTLTVETRVKSSELSTHTRTMRLDCIVLKPHQE